MCLFRVWLRQSGRKTPVRPGAGEETAISTTGAASGRQRGGPRRPCPRRSEHRAHHFAGKANQALETGAHAKTDCHAEATFEARGGKAVDSDSGKAGIGVFTRK